MPDLFIARPKQQKTEMPISPKVSNSSTPKKPWMKKVPVLASFTEHPANLKFEHQEPGETIHLFLRRHFITNFHWIIGTFFSLLLPLAAFFLIPFFNTINLSVPQSYLFILAAFYYLILLGYAFINFITWYYNVGIITSLRVVDIDIAYITSKNVAATGLTDIVDVEYSQSGFLQNLFDYGNVHMQTEGLKANFEFLNIPKPAKASDIITDLMREAKNE